MPMWQEKGFTYQKNSLLNFCFMSTHFESSEVQARFLQLLFVCEMLFVGRVPLRSWSLFFGVQPKAWISFSPDLPLAAFVASSVNSFCFDPFHYRKSSRLFPEADMVQHPRVTLGLFFRKFVGVLAAPFKSSCLQYHRVSRPFTIAWRLCRSRLGGRSLRIHDVRSSRSFGFVAQGVCYPLLLFVSYL